MFINQINNNNIVPVDIGTLPEMVFQFYNKALYIYGEDKVSIQYDDRSLTPIPEYTYFGLRNTEERIYVIIIKIGDVIIKSHGNFEGTLAQHTLIGTYMMFSFILDETLSTSGYTIDFNIARDRLFNSEYDANFSHPHVNRTTSKCLDDSDYLIFHNNTCLGASQLKILLNGIIPLEDTDERFYSLLILGKQFLETENVDDTYKTLDEVYGVIDESHIISLYRQVPHTTSQIKMLIKYKSKLLPLIMQNVRFINNKIVINKFITISKEFFNNFEVSNLVAVKMFDSFYTRNSRNRDTVITNNLETGLNVDLIFKDKPVILKVVQDIEANNELNSYNLYLNPNFIMQVEKYLNSQLNFIL